MVVEVEVRSDGVRVRCWRQCRQGLLIDRLWCEGKRQFFGFQFEFLGEWWFFLFREGERVWSRFEVEEIKDFFWIYQFGMLVVYFTWSCQQRAVSEVRGIGCVFGVICVVMLFKVKWMRSFRKSVIRDGYTVYESFQSYRLGGVKRNVWKDILVRGKVSNFGS